MKTLEFFTETLESRRMLAGLVQLEISAEGDISILGDRQDNSVLISQTSIGLDISGLDGTLIELDGQQNLSHAIDLGTVNIPRNLFVRMDNGDDRLQTNLVNLSGQLDVDLGRGNDAFVKHSGEFNGAAIIRGGRGRGNDSIVATGEFNHDVVIELGAASVENMVDLHNTSINGDLTMTGKQARVAIRESFFSKSVNASMGRTALIEVEASTITGDVNFEHAGKYAVFALEDESAVAGSVRATGGRTVILSVDESEVAGPVQVDITSGIVALDESNFSGEVSIAIRRAARIDESRYSGVGCSECTLTSPLQIATGSGPSIVSLQESEFDAVDVDLGGGRDILLVSDNDFVFGATIDGGTGFDQYLLGPNQSLGVELISFEAVLNVSG